MKSEPQRLGGGRRQSHGRPTNLYFAIGAVILAMSRELGINESAEVNDLVFDPR
jgi:hypothetical protein